MKSMIIRKQQLILFIIYCSLSIIYCPLSIAQDIHFTQFDNSPLNLNPANTGLFNGDYRLNLIDRDQWSSITVPFKTFSASFDTKLITNSYKKDMFGIGIVFYNDKAGTSDFGTTEAELSLSYTKSLDALATQYLSFGIMAGMGQRTLNTSNLTFDNQFNGYVYDPAMPGLEQFNNTNFIFPDISAGVNWLYYIKPSGIYY